MFRWKPRFDFWWPRLAILHDPPSYVHWIKALNALRASDARHDPCTLVPGLIIAAARHGLGILEKRAVLCNIALIGKSLDL